MPAFGKWMNGLVSGSVVALLTFMLGWFFARNIVDGLGPAAENGVFIGVVCTALGVGYSSGRAAFRRGG